MPVGDNIELGSGTLYFNGIEGVTDSIDISEDTEWTDDKEYIKINDALGIPRTARGQVVGWIYTGEYPFEEPYVDIGLYNEQNRAFINGTENKVLLDFNVDGDILKYL